MSFKAEVIADSSGKWAGNGLCFATAGEAQDYVRDLEWRWTSVRDTRVVEGDWPVTHRWNAEARKVEHMPIAARVWPAGENTDGD